MLRAGGVDELDEAMREWVDPSNNFVSIDVHGDIQYLNRGRLPVRSMANAWLPVPGWSDEYEWSGFVPFDEMIRSRNPDTGYIVTANNKIAGDDYPHYISLYYGSDHRARRILGRLEGLTGATVDDMADVHRDIVSIPGRTYAALLGETEPCGEAAKRAVELLAAWDGSMHRDLVAPTIYSAFRRELDRRVLAPLLGPLADEAFGAAGRGAPRQVGHLSTLLASHAAAADTSMLPDGADWRSVTTQALEAAVAYLRGRLGDDVDSWRWGSIHGTAPRHPAVGLVPRSRRAAGPTIDADERGRRHAAFRLLQCRRPVHGHRHVRRPLRLRRVRLGQLPLGRAAGRVRPSWQLPLRRPEADLGGRRRGPHAVHVAGRRGGGRAKADTEASARGVAIGHDRGHMEPC